MIFRASDLYDKEVICVKDGSKLGLMSDVEINSNTGYVETIIIYGRSRLFGLLGREEDTIIPWSCIEVLGEDIILVNCEPPRVRHRNGKKMLRSFLDL